MADTRQFLRLSVDGGNYLLPSTAGFTIEQRDNLQVNDMPSSHVSAWRMVRNSRWPAYALDRDFRPVRRAQWERAVFVEAMPHAIGIIVDDVHLLARGQAQVMPFVPLGPAPTRAGHLFSAAWVTETELLLVLEPQALMLYLQTLGE
jgi:hypothetical protein